MDEGSDSIQIQMCVVLRDASHDSMRVSCFLKKLVTGALLVVTSALLVVTIRI